MTANVKLLVNSVWVELPATIIETQQVSHFSQTPCYDIIEDNFYSSWLAEACLHFHFRLSLQHCMSDGVQWEALAH